MAADSGPSPRPRVLIVDDEARFGRLLATALGAEHYAVEVLDDAPRALEQLRATAYDVVVSDIRMPGCDGVTLAREARRANPRTEVLLMTAYATVENAVEALRVGVRDYLIKPFDMEELRAKVREAAGAREAEPAAAPSRPPDGVVGQSATTEEILRLADQVAPTDATVLLLGESGTGKGLLARTIHRRSPRGEGHFVEIHCAALPETLLESELFGHEKGAFTGATEAKIGQLEAANGGTVFLDEIGHVPLAVQVKLLRFLQDREILRVGGTRARTVDTRVIAATNRDLSEAIAAGEFREDLFYRLNVFPIHMPPLRDRRDDVPPLVAHLLERSGHGGKTVACEAMARLRAWHWPGNVRELQNVLERACILAGDDAIRIAHLPEALRAGGGDLSEAREGVEAAAIGAAASAEAAPPEDREAEADLALDAREREIIEDALERAGGNKARAARLLGISRRRLYSRLERLGAYEGRVRRRT